MQALSYAKGISNTPLLTETISQRLKKTVNKYPNNEALVVPYQNYRATYQKFWCDIEEVALGFLAYGVKKGDRVGVWSPNRYEWILVQYALSRIGAIMVTVNPAYKSAELKYALNQSEISLLVMAEGFRKTNYTEILNEVHDLCTYLKRVVVFEQNWDDMLNAGKNISVNTLIDIEDTLQINDPINIQYTSGTTGFPKGATLSHYNILNNGYFVGERLKYSQTDRVCVPVPLYHCFGMVMASLACISVGACIVLSGEAFNDVHFSS